MQYVPTQFGVTGPDASPMVAQLGGQVAGTGAYAFLNPNFVSRVVGIPNRERRLVNPEPGEWPMPTQVKLKEHQSVPAYGAQP